MSHVAPFPAVNKAASLSLTRKSCEALCQQGALSMKECRGDEVVIFA